LDSFFFGGGLKKVKLMFFLCLECGFPIIVKSAKVILKRAVGQTFETLSGISPEKAGVSESSAIIVSV